MKKNKNSGYPYLSEDRLSYIYKCVKCKAHIKKGIVACYRCGYEFTRIDVDKMIREYKENYSKNWHVKIYFVLFVGAIIILLLGIN
ncbi:hypothetical protein [Pseudoalteromonas sp. BSi20652]|uniref:hypothetical protein n=1 Tax=Pseudoalteromonas sp. BSi20652 TaxID=388384 RepID=UPI0005196154|nr:hypothetical protein [Pseudoalteromonas sp. BSi20652]